ncbi:diguanylate cyclase [Reinekea marina]|uniref:diguanylate cyclase n=1 Tax=Reinekea marina TaxID=1310421 RepID=A0ABV7WR04_9GAMM|nr:diguanylate cyclase [Reinekea marina]MDN3647829.1 diguanylate cyclase [Reinekea marina]
MKLAVRLKILSVLSLVSLLLVLGYLVASNYLFLSLKQKQKTMHQVNVLLSELTVNADLYLEIRDEELLNTQRLLSERAKKALSDLSSHSSGVRLHIDSICRIIESNEALLNQISSSFKSIPNMNGSAAVVSHLKARLSNAYISAQNDATTLSDELWVEQLGIIQLWGMTLALLIVVSIAFVIYSHINFANRFKRAVAKVLDGLANIRDGDLKTAINLEQNDELTDIARQINSMAKNLNELTVSKTELEAQIMARTIELQVETRTDTLTGVHNRRSLERVGERELNMALRYGQTLSMLMIDLDGFKPVNDTYGHSFGDIVLIQAAQTIATELRDSDFLARYGGEEFTVILPHTDFRSAYETAERIRKAFECKLFGDSEHRIQQTISVGIAEMSEREATLQELIELADKRLYQAKNKGRNRSYPTQQEN